MLRLKELRKEIGISQKQFAKDFGVGQNTVSRWETGDRLLDAETLNSVAEYFDVSVDYLLGKSDIKKNNNLLKVEEMQDELFLKRKLLFDMSAKATKEDLDKIIKIVDTLIDDN